MDSRLSMTEIAKKFGLDKATVSRRVKKHGIPVVRDGDRLLIDMNEFERWVKPPGEYIRVTDVAKELGIDAVTVRKRCQLYGVERVKLSVDNRTSYIRRDQMQKLRKHPLARFTPGDNCKTCTRCEKTKPLDDFYVISKTTRRMPHCKSCHTALTAPTRRKWRQENPEKVKEHKMKWQAKNQERVKEFRRRGQETYMDRLRSDPARYARWRERRNAYYKAKRAEKREAMRSQVNGYGT